MLFGACCECFNRIKLLYSIYLQVYELQKEISGAEEAAEEERLSRKAAELTLHKEMEALERSCETELKRQGVSHNIEIRRLKQAR